jgi:hypothetical protein
MGIRRRLVYALVTLLGGCGGASASTPASPASDPCGDAPGGRGDHTLLVSLAVDREGQRGALCRGQQLTAADTLWVTVDLDTASYVRMVFVTPLGETGEVMRQDAADLTREALFRAPRGLMAHAQGDVQLVIVASRDPLTEVDPMLSSMLDVIRDTGVIVDRDGSLKAVGSGQGMKPEEQLFNIGSGALTADFDGNGVAVLTLSLHTAP